MTNDNVVSVYIPGNIDYYDSYGLIGCQLIRHLTKMGRYVNAISMGRNKHPNQPSDIQLLVDRPIQPVFGGILLGYPTGYDKYGPMAAHGPRVAVTMFESSKLPDGWVSILNDMDAVIVPSWFCSEVFNNCGVTAPTYVLPLGIGEFYSNISRRIPTNKDESYKFATGFCPSYEGRVDPDAAIRPYRKGPVDDVRLLPRPFTFLTFNDRGPRKGGEIAKNAFLKEFGDDENFHLVIKERKAKIPLIPTNKNITHIQADFSEFDLASLYLSVDCLVNPHKGEGFGLIPREFAATGGIALTTNWSGTADGIERWGVPLIAELVGANWDTQPKFAGMDLGLWANVSVDECAEAMRSVYENRDTHFAMSRFRSHNARQLYSWPAFVRNVLDIWEGVLHGDPTRLPVVAG